MLECTDLHCMLWCLKTAVVQNCGKGHHPNPSNFWSYQPSPKLWIWTCTVSVSPIHELGWGEAAASTLGLMNWWRISAHALLSQLIDYALIFFLIERRRRAVVAQVIFWYHHCKKCIIVLEKHVGVAVIKSYSFSFSVNDPNRTPLSPSQPFYKQRWDGACLVEKHSASGLRSPAE